MLTEAVYLLFGSLVPAVVAAPLFAWPVGLALGKADSVRPGFFRLALVCLLGQFSALAVHILGGLLLGMPRPPVRPDISAWLINALLLFSCFIFWLKRIGHQGPGKSFGAALLFTALTLLYHLALFMVFMNCLLPD